MYNDFIGVDEDGKEIEGFIDRAVRRTERYRSLKKKFGEGRRIFLMSPLHHHYQKKGYHESKIVTRFWIVGILLAIIAVATLKIR